MNLPIQSAGVDRRVSNAFNRVAATEVGTRPSQLERVQITNFGRFRLPFGPIVLGATCTSDDGDVCKCKGGCWADATGCGCED